MKNGALILGAGAGLALLLALASKKEAEPDDTSLTVSGVTPSSGPAGTVVNVIGTGFVTGATVTIGSLAVTTFVSSTSLTAVVPTGSGIKDVVVTNPDGESVTLSSGFTYATIAPLAITSIAPNSGPLAGGTAVVITGTGFVSGCVVTIDSLSVEEVFVSATSITATTPAGTVGAKDVKVTNPSGLSSTFTGGFTYTEETTTSTLAVTSTPAGASISVDGTLIGLSPQNIPITTGLHTISASLTDYVSQSYTVRITAGNNTLNFVLNLTSLFQINYITPTSSPTTGGVSLTIAGAGFVSGCTVTIGDVAASLVVVDNVNYIRVVSPVNTVGVKNVVVTHPDGRKATLPSSFTYVVSTTTTVTILSVPTGGALFIDGVSAGLTPVNNYTVTPGTHSFICTMAGKLTFNLPLNIPLGTSPTYTFRFSDG
jgi:hypothetical protein